MRLKTLFYGLNEVVFPNVCVCCGLETTERERDICSFCLQEYFEELDWEERFQTGDALLPDGITAQLSLWAFDKGGRLQDLMHFLKYERLTNIGRQLGERLATKLKRHPLMRTYTRQEELVLVPVPLHYLKFRYRGFNQSFEIARGIAETIDAPICSQADVVRRKHTRTQTGLNLNDRMKNMEDAFRVRSAERFNDKIACIVDDVFTTGTTTFELSRTLLRAGAREVVILTIAQA